MKNQIIKILDQFDCAIRKPDSKEWDIEKGKLVSKIQIQWSYSLCEGTEKERDKLKEKLADKLVKLFDITKKLNQNKEKIKNALEAIDDAVGNDYEILNLVENILKDN